MEPVKEVRYTEESPQRIKAHENDVKRNEDGTADVFVWGFLFSNCDVRRELLRTGFFCYDHWYVIVTHPTGNVLKVGLEARSLSRKDYLKLKRDGVPEVWP